MAQLTRKSRGANANSASRRAKQNHFATRKFALSMGNFTPTLGPALARPPRAASHARPRGRHGRLRGALLRLADAGPLRHQQPALADEQPPLRVLHQRDGPGHLHVAAPAESGDAQQDGDVLPRAADAPQPEFRRSEE